MACRVSACTPPATSFISSGLEPIYPDTNSRSLDFLSTLAVLVPRPRHNLVRYHGVFAPNSKMRQLIVPKRNRPIEKVKKSNEKLKQRENFQIWVSNLAELYAPLTWAERATAIQSQNML